MSAEYLLGCLIALGTLAIVGCWIWFTWLLCSLLFAVHAPWATMLGLYIILQNVFGFISGLGKVR